MAPRKKSARNEILFETYKAGFEIKALSQIFGLGDDRVRSIISNEKYRRAVASSHRAPWLPRLSEFCATISKRCGEPANSSDIVIWRYLIGEIEPTSLKLARRNGKR